MTHRSQKVFQYRQCSILIIFFFFRRTGQGRPGIQHSSRRGNIPRPNFLRRRKMLRFHTYFFPNKVDHQLSSRLRVVLSDRLSQHRLHSVVHLKTHTHTHTHTTCAPGHIKLQSVITRSSSCNSYSNSQLTERVVTKVSIPPVSSTEKMANMNAKYYKHMRPTCHIDHTRCACLIQIPNSHSSQHTLQMHVTVLLLFFLVLNY